MKFPFFSFDTESCMTMVLLAVIEIAIGILVIPYLLMLMCNEVIFAQICSLINNAISREDYVFPAIRFDYWFYVCVWTISALLRSKVSFNNKKDKE